MNPKLTSHASQRVIERCSIRPEVLEALIRSGATAVIEMLSAARYAHHLFYSPEDIEWFVALIENSKQIRTIMPAEWEQHRVRLTKAQKRSVRRKALEWERKGGFSAVPPQPKAGKAASSAQFVHLPGVKVTVSYILDGCTLSKNLGRTHAEHGTPDDWTRHAEVHRWFKQQITEAGIPIGAIMDCRVTMKSGECRDGWCLLENLLMTPEEIATCA